MTNMRERLIEAAGRVALRSIEHRDGTMERAFLGGDSASALVDAILAELRVPDETMIEAGAELDEWVTHEGQAPQPEVFTAMIDAIRGEQG